MGFLFAGIAILSWGLGDFLIQRSARKFGDSIALFFIVAFGTIAIFPFVYKEIPLLFAGESFTGLIILSIATIVTLFAALFDFEALRIGKISVIESIYAFELGVTAFLGTYIAGEYLSNQQIILITFIIVGIFLVSLQSLNHLREIKFEKGVWYAIIATIAMGGVNFLFGEGARATSPLLINWFTSAGITVVLLVYFIRKKMFALMFSDLKENLGLVISVSFFDNLAWIAFAYTTLYIPIAVATGITESYIAFAALLGVMINKERLNFHQFAGFLLTVGSAIILAIISG
jgi:drug/metabolite transporter (DMT)-like permease